MGLASLSSLQPCGFELVARVGLWEWSGERSFGGMAEVFGGGGGGLLAFHVYVKSVRTADDEIAWRLRRLYRSECAVYVHVGDCRRQRQIGEGVAVWHHQVLRQAMDCHLSPIPSM